MANEYAHDAAWLTARVDGDRVPQSAMTYQLERDAVHVWAARLDTRQELIDRFWKILDQEERQRANRFRFDTFRTRFILAHGFLRELLGRYLDIDARKIIFERDSYGKPHVVDREFEFNLSHSGALAVIAVSASSKVGVDVEKIRPLPDLDAIARRLFTRAEYAQICASPPNRRVDTFFTCWTRKEAFIKALGKGLSIPLDSFEIPLDHGVLNRPICAPGNLGGPGLWRLSDLPSLEGYVGAVVAEGQSHSLPTWLWMSAPV
jgi:4'-phosphopantetheinyl transferase